MPNHRLTKISIKRNYRRYLNIGQPNRKTTTTLVSTTIIIVCSLSVLTMIFSNVIPSNIAIKIAEIASICVAIIMLFYVWRLPTDSLNNNRDTAIQGKVSINKPTTMLTGIMRTIISKPYFIAPLNAVIFALLAYYFFAFTVPWVHTSVFGIKGNNEFIVNGWTSGGSRHCSRPTIEIGATMLLSGRALCGTGLSKEQLPNGTELSVYGKKSNLGILTSNITIKNQLSR